MTEAAGWAGRVLVFLRVAAHVVAVNLLVVAGATWVLTPDVTEDPDAAMSALGKLVPHCSSSIASTGECVPVTCGAIGTARARRCR